VFVNIRLERVMALLKNKSVTIILLRCRGLATEVNSSVKLAGTFEDKERKSKFAGKEPCLWKNILNKNLAPAKSKTSRE